jgi:hypothetical protein
MHEKDRRGDRPCIHQRNRPLIQGQIEGETSLNSGARQLFRKRNEEALEGGKVLKIVQILAANLFRVRRSSAGSALACCKGCPRFQSWPGGTPGMTLFSERQQ